MSFQITENFVEQFGSNFRILGQQKKSRFEGWCQPEPNIVGTSKSVERIGSSEAYDLTSRHADTKYVDTPHSRRWLDLSDKAWSDLVDEMDKIKMLADPTSPYVAVGRAALNRKRDDTILAAATGDARSNSGAIALPSGQKIAVGSDGLTIAKLLQAKEILDASEIDVDDSDGQQDAPTRVIGVSTRQVTNLLNTTEVKSTDYNTIKALAEGKINAYAGFRFVRSERIRKVSTTRYLPVWIKGCVAFGWGMDVVVSIDRLPTKNYSVQVYARESVGATRIEDAGVVEIACLES